MLAWYCQSLSFWLFINDSTPILHVEWKNNFMAFKFIEFYNYILVDLCNVCILLQENITWWSAYSTYWCNDKGHVWLAAELWFTCYRLISTLKYIQRESLQELLRLQIKWEIDAEDSKICFKQMKFQLQ